MSGVGRGYPGLGGGVRGWEGVSGVGRGCPGLGGGVRGWEGVRKPTCLEPGMLIV